MHLPLGREHRRRYCQVDEEIVDRPQDAELEPAVNPPCRGSETAASLNLTIPSAGFQGVNTRLDGLNTSLSSRMDRLGNQYDGLDERLRNVEVGLDKVNQKLLTIERIVLPGGEQPSE